MSDGKENPANPGTADTGTSRDNGTSAAAEKTDAAVLTLLVCPVTKSPLDYDATAQELISHGAGLAFPIREGIPIMLVDQARILDDNE